MLHQPSDLITANDAAVLCGKSKSTIRNWVRQGILNGYKLDELKKNSALLISLKELNQVTNLARIPVKNNPVSTSAEKLAPSSAVIDELTNKIHDLWEKNVQLEAKVDTLQGENTILQEMLKQAERMEAQLIKAREFTERELERQVMKLNEVNNRANKLEKKMSQLTIYMSLPWWKRLFTPFPIMAIDVN